VLYAPPSKENFKIDLSRFMKAEENDEDEKELTDDRKAAEA
jgi:hypothetical protein